MCKSSKHGWFFYMKVIVVIDCYSIQKLFQEPTLPHSPVKVTYFVCVFLSHSE